MCAYVCVYPTRNGRPAGAPACFRHVSTHCMGLQPVIFMHEISSDNTEEFTIPGCMNHHDS